MTFTNSVGKLQKILAINYDLYKFRRKTSENIYNREIAWNKKSSILEIPSFVG